MKKLITVSLFCLILMTVSSALAGPFPPNVANDIYSGVVNGIPTANGGNDGIPDIFDAINRIQGTAYANNAAVDPLFVEPHAIWQQLDGSIALIGLTAGYNNTVGVYTDIGVGANQTALLGPYSGFGWKGDGTGANPYPAAMIGLGTGTNFGWYLYANQAQNYFSEAGLNPAGWDHMMTFDLPQANGTTIYVDYGSGATSLTLNDPYLIAWEDLAWDGSKLGDEDYDDMMYLVD